ncbi:hypothetical protein GCM10009092_37590 [Bowmanella denitrificans]|uniref:PEP-CTERM system TPR-repeat protein PrsT n=1 Tax=Bowmanella denitrificans TaxID=366582 RepID=A0ABN0XPX1_9ALTE
MDNQMKVIKKTLVAVMIMSFLSGCSQKTPEESLNDAQAFIAAGDKSAAVIELKNAIRQSPTNAQLRMSLARIYISLSEFDSAEKELKRAAEQEYQGEDLIPLLLQVKAQLKQSEEASEYAQQLIAREQSNEDTQYGLFLVAKSFIEKGLPKRIAPFSEYLDKTAAGSIYNTLLKGWLAYSEERYEEAKQLASSVLEVRNEQVDALELSGLLSENTGAAKDAINIYQRLVELRPTNPDFALHLAHNLILDDQPERAESYLLSLLKVNRMDPVSNMLMSTIKFERQDYEGAKTMAELALSANPNLKRARLVAGLSAFRLEAYEQSYNHLVKIYEELPKAHQARRTLQVLRLQLGYIDELAQQLEKADEFEPELYTATAFELVRLGDIEQARAISEKLADSDNLSANTLSQRGILKLSLNDQSGFDDLEKAVKDNPEQEQFRYLLVSEYIGAERYEDAFKAVEQWLSVNDISDMAYFLKGIALIRKGSIEESTLAFEKAVELNPQNIGALINLALQNVVKKEYQTASDYFGRVLLVRPDYYIGIMHLHRIAETTNDLLLARKPLEAALEKHPDSLQLILGLARILDTFGESIQVAKLLNKLSPEQKKHPGYLSLMGGIQLKEGQYKSAEESYRKLIEVAKQIPASYKRLITVYEMQRDFDSALDIANKGAAIFPEDLFFVQLQAYFMTLKGRYEEAELLVRKLDSENIYSDSADKARARIAANKGQSDVEIEHYYRIYARTPNPVNAVNVASRLAANQQHAEAEKLLRDYHQRYSVNTFTLAYLGEVQLTSNPRQAVATYIQLLKEKPVNVAYLNNLAQAYLAVSEPERALEYALQALASNNQIPQVKDTLGWAYFKNGNLTESLKFLELAHRDSDSIEVALHYATVLKANHNMEKAEAVLNKLNPKTDGERQQIEKIRAQ